MPRRTRASAKARRSWCGVKGQRLSSARRPCRDASRRGQRCGSSTMTLSSETPVLPGLPLAASFTSNAQC
eukprot:8838004-Pyramimonas_sp.AAC.1